MARKNIIVGNWKMNKTPTEAKRFMNSFKKLYAKNKSKIKNMQFGIGAPAVDLAILKEAKITGMLIAAEDIHAAKAGAYTGDLSASMVKAVGANAVIIGHSERRAYHGETDADVNAKTQTALASGLLPIICVGETKAQREAGARVWKAHVRKQVKQALKGIEVNQLAKLVIAYEPIWAIGTGLVATFAQAEEACALVRQEVAKISAEAAAKIRIQYGGSVKPETISDLISQPNVDGALVGGASLEANSYIKLLTLNA